MTRVAVLGARGRMGSESVKAIQAADGLELVGQIDIGDDIDDLLHAEVETVLDFTRPDAVADHLSWCIEHDVNAVVGTSGFDAAAIDGLRARVGDQPRIGILVVPNFSIGAVLMMRFSEIAAPYFESVEVIELHHPDKVDAPSGTALRTAQQIAHARAEAGSAPMPDATVSDPLGARGADVDGVRIHAVRARGIVASQEVVFGDQGETFTLRHDSIHRESFMPGVVTALRQAGHLRGVHMGLETVLDL